MIKDKVLFTESDEEDRADELPEENKFLEYEIRKNQLVSKEFAYAVIQELKSQ